MHFLQDVLPYILEGNTPDDPTSFIDRIFVLINSMTYTMGKVQLFKFVPYLEEG